MRYPLPYAFARTHQLLLEEDAGALTLWLHSASQPAAVSEVCRKYPQSSLQMQASAALVQRIYQPLTGLTNARVDLMTAMVSFDRGFEVLDAPESITDRPGAVDLVDPVGRIELDHVRFRYPAAADVTVRSLEAPSALGGTDPDRDVLVDVSLVLEPGETVALVGSSGSGKTSLASLLPRLYDVSDGAVRIDGHDVRDLTQTSLRAAIGVVSQDPHLFHDTIGANLRYAKADATDAELDEACRGARILDTVVPHASAFA